MLARVLLLGLLALVGLSFPAWATGPANYPPGGSGSGVVANTCTSGDFFSAVDGSGNFTCATPAGSGDVTAVGDCASGDCFTASSNNSSLIFEGSTADTSETTLTVTDPTADRTVTLPNLTGTVAIERVYDVRAYGAKCDDSTDDTAAIQAAIDAAEATGQGGVVQFPVGICIHTALTMDEPGVILRGMGASTSNNGTRLSCNITTGTCITMQSSCTYCGVENLGIGARGTPTDLVLIDGTSASNDHVSNLILGTQGYCTGIKNVLRNDNVDLFGPIAGASCRGISVVDDAVYLNRITGNWSTDIEGMIVIEQTSTNITDTVVISDTEIAQSGGAGAGLKIIGASTTNPPRWVEVSNSLFEAKTTGASAGDYPIYIDNVKEFKCTNCYAHGGFYAVRIDGGPGPIRFVNSEIGDARRDALYHDADVPTELIGTTVSDGSQETTNTYSGIHLTTNSRQFTMIGGRASDDLFFSGSGQKYGILIDAGADEYRFDNVGCEGNDTACASGLSPAAAQAAFTDAVALADSDWSNYVTLRASSLAGNYSLTLPTTDGATNDLLYNTDGSGTLGWRTPNAGTDITADLEEETHASEHSAGGADAITVTNLASACTDAQVLGGNAGGTGVECQTDDDVPEAADYSNLTAGTGITNSPTGTINATLGTAITSSEITDGEIVNADISATAAIALSKLANMSTDRLLGRDTAGSGAIEELTVGGGIEFTGSGGIQRSAFSGGDVTASAGSATLTIGADKITEAMLKVVDSPSDEECLTYESTGGDFEWQSCGSGGSGISGIAADSGGTTTGSTVTITGTGTDTTRSTDTISVDVDMTEVSLTKGSIWQGNSSSLATAYSNPSGIDIRTYGAACNGSQDDSQEIQNLIDDLNTAGGGTVLIPNTGSPCMVSTETANDYIQMKSNVNIVCAPGAEIKASSATPPLALIKATGTGASSVNNWRISGCYFNLDQQKISAVYIEEGSNFSFDHNSADFNGDGDATSTNTTAFDIVHLDCKATEYGPSASPPYEGAPCTITHNSVRGSEVDAQNDTCFSVFGSGGLLGLGHGAMFANNFAQFCGGACLNAFEALTISANNLADCLDQGINSSDASNQLSSSAITGNVIQATGTEAGFYGVNVQNLQIVGNSFPILGTGRAIQLRTSAGATISGVNIANNYAANTIHLDAVGSCVGGANIGQDCDADADCPASTCGTYGQFNHDIIFNNILSSPPTATWAGIDIENAQGWITVIDNTDVGTSASTRSSVKFTSLDSVKKGGILVANNNLSPAGAGTGTCITFDHTAGGALEAVNVVGNLCGGVDSTGTTIASIDKGLEIVGSPTRTNFNMDGNNFGNTTTAYTGITDRNVVQQTTAPACVAAGTAANDTWHIEDFSYTNAVAGKPVFINVNVTFTDANTTIEDIEWFLYDNGSTACPTDCTTTAPSGTALAPTGGIVTKSTAVAAQNQSTAFLWIDTVPIAGTNIYCLGLENATNATGDPTVGNVTFSAWQ